MFVQTNPVPVKKTAALMGICSDAVRLPLVTITEDNMAKLAPVLQEYGLGQIDSP